MLTKVLTSGIRDIFRSVLDADQLVEASGKLTDAQKKLTMGITAIGEGVQELLAGAQEWTRKPVFSKRSVSGFRTGCRSSRLCATDGAGRQPTGCIL